MGKRQRKIKWIIHFRRGKKRESSSVHAFTQEQAKTFGTFLTKVNKQFKGFHVTQVRAA